MLGSKRLDAIDGEKGLKIKGLLAPQRAVIVKGGDSFGDRNKIRRTFFRNLFNKSNDRLFRCGVIPRGQRIALGQCGKSEEND